MSISVRGGVIARPPSALPARFSRSEPVVCHTGLDVSVDFSDRRRSSGFLSRQGLDHRLLFGGQRSPSRHRGVERCGPGDADTGTTAPHGAGEEVASNLAVVGTDRAAVNRRAGADRG